MSLILDLEPDKALGLERAETMLKGIIIPPRPSILVEVLTEQSCADPDLKLIAKLISRDVALSAGVLKVVNSPFFALRTKATSVYSAVTLLGVSNVVNIITGLMLHSAFAQGKNEFMDRFWSNSSAVAMIAAMVAREYTSVPPDEAYSVGLFLDCGIPLLVRRFPEYPELYKKAVNDVEQVFTAHEDAQIGTDHATVGYMVAKSWKLPVSFCQCILRHHDTLNFVEDDLQGTSIRELLAVSMLSLHIFRQIEGLPEAREWQLQGQDALSMLNLTPAEVAEATGRVREIIAAGGVF